MEIKWLPYVPLYIALCEERSIAGAANRLGCSNAHASRQLRQLEDILAVQLIQRTTRQFNLTQDGIAFYKQVKALFENAESINDSLCGKETLTGKLRIAASASFGALLLAEPFAEFKRDYPEIALEIIYTEKPLDLIDSGFDVAIYLTESPPEGYVGHYLRSRQCKPFAHQSYLDGHGTIEHPSQLNKYRHILYRNTEFTLDRWTFTEANTNHTVKVKLHHDFSVNLVNAMVDTMMAGCGVAMLDEFALAKLPTDKRAEVVELLPNWQTSAILPLYILYPKREHLPKRTRLLVEFLKQRLQGM
ncbi:LysR family transcriptional regulator [Photobacterium jeanii]|uniref:LysR family transcriptional regulator n=1 Tax=Photobacterium jeanii TaxID=858640 RepID=A0A178K1Q2_9GAMM|nr:LysR family transcriptional regulator [Photobacterium jeanii]OAN10875.1 LysR family transcriptional regulator [Photobacterium jeanii]PST90390.1 LysR family transcriptional regulator [Photobacterium jeanii]